MNPMEFIVVLRVVADLVLRLLHMIFMFIK